MILALAALSIYGCSYKYAVWLLPESTDDNLTFVVGKRKYDKERIEIYDLLVTRENGSGNGISRLDTLWHLSQETFTYGRSERLKFKDIKYGIVPAGMAEKHRAESLNTGEFLIDISMPGGFAMMFFRVLEDGRVVEID